MDLKSFWFFPLCYVEVSGLVGAIIQHLSLWSWTDDDLELNTRPCSVDLEFRCVGGEVSGLVQSGPSLKRQGLRQRRRELTR